MNRLTNGQDIYRHNIQFLNWINVFNALYFMIPIWIAFELRYLTLTQLTIIEMVIAASQIVLELPTGALADLLGRRISVALGYLVGGIGYVVFSYSTNFSMFLATAFLFGLGESLISGAKDALVYDTLKQTHQEKKFSELANKWQIIFNWGLGFSAALGGFLFQLHFRLPGLLSAGSYLICAWLSLKLIEPSIDSEKFTLKNYLRQTKAGFNELFQTPTIKKISWFYILIGGISWPVVITLKSLALVKLSFSELMMGLMTPVLTLSVTYLLQYLVKRETFEKLSLTFLSLPIIAISGLSLAIIFHRATILPLIWLLMFVSSARWNILGKMTNYFYAAKNRATAISTLNLIISLIYLFFMSVLSLFSLKFENSLQLVFLFMSGCAAVFLLPLASKLSREFKNQQLDFNDQFSPALAETKKSAESA